MSLTIDLFIEKITEFADTPPLQLHERTWTQVLNKHDIMNVNFSAKVSYSSMAKHGDSQTV